MERVERTLTTLRRKRATGRGTHMLLIFHRRVQKFNRDDERTRNPTPWPRDQRVCTARIGDSLRSHPLSHPSPHIQPPLPSFSSINQSINHRTFNDRYMWISATPMHLPAGMSTEDLTENKTVVSYSRLTVTVISSHTSPKWQQRI